VSVELVPQTFALRVGERFSAVPTFAGEPFDLVLTHCDVTGAETPQGREPFSLIFQAETPAHVPQQIVSLTNDALGEFHLFVVPLGPEDGRMRYEAVVN
jgi:hypothetical protein